VTTDPIFAGRYGIREPQGEDGCDFSTVIVQSMSAGSVVT
jgi:hypothetical protein